MIIMKTHAALGGQTVEYAEKTLGKHAEFLQTAREIAQSHHEKWDGSGYPEGLSGDAIPISARLMALADVYDALISRRVYKEPMPHENAVEFILAGKAAHFDPDIVDAFLAIVDEFRAIADRYRDPEHVQQPS
jgi:putative two-component system response regulator